jgi:hypothetical protein
LLRKLETVEKSLVDNAKIVIPTGSELVLKREKQE